MSETENMFQQPRPDSGVESLRKEVDTLRAVISFSVLLMFVFSICVNIFLFQQAKTVSEEAAQRQAVVQNFNTTMAMPVRDFWLRAKDYARTHPDYQPVIAKYIPMIDGQPKK